MVGFFFLKKKKKKKKKQQNFLVGKIAATLIRAFSGMKNELFDNQFDKVLECEKEVYLIGDLNHDLFQENIKQTWLEYINHLVLNYCISN